MSGYNASANTGPHASNLANKIDPRVDASQLEGSSTTRSGNQYGSGNTSQYASGSHTEPRLMTLNATKHPAMHIPRVLPLGGIT